MALLGSRRNPCRARVAMLAASVTVLLSCFLFVDSVTAQHRPQLTTQDPEEFADHGQRTLWALDAGYQLPIEISAVRNFHHKHWMRDLKLEVKNISNRPIYCVYLMMYLPDDTYARGPGSPPLGVILAYGAHRLLDPDERPTADDKPLEPGASAVLTVDERRWRGYESHLIKDKVPAEASYRVRIVVLGVNFGDGTGFINGGVPFPRDPGAPNGNQPKYVKLSIGSGA